MKMSTDPNAYDHLAALLFRSNLYHLDKLTPDSRHNSRFRDIGRCFRRSLPPLSTPVALHGHVTPCHHTGPEFLLALEATFETIHKPTSPLLFLPFLPK